MSIAVVAISLATALYLNSPTSGQLIILIIVLVLTPLSGFHHARRFLVVVDQPEHVSGAANWDDNSLVIGYKDETQAACAWLLETLIPHHLFNDTVNKKPVLVAW